MLAAEPLAIYTYHRLLDEWPLWRDLALSPALLKSITEHSLLRLAGGGATVYSPGHGGSTDALYGQLGLSPDRRLLVAYPSSMDEYYANMNMMAGALGQCPVPQRSALPRPNDMVARADQACRAKQRSATRHPHSSARGPQHHRHDGIGQPCQSQAGIFRLLPACPHHLAEEPISSYDLAEIADVALSGWSNISLELARFGIPTLTAFKRYVPFPLATSWTGAPPRARISKKSAPVGQVRKQCDAWSVPSRARIADLSRPGRLRGASCLPSHRSRRTR